MGIGMGMISMGLGMSKNIWFKKSIAVCSFAQKTTNYYDLAACSAKIDRIYVTVRVRVY